jgi:hypothetical protein
VLLLLALACAAPDAGPAPAGSRSADLAQRVANVGTRSEQLAARTRELEGLFDELRAATPEGREAVKARIRERAQGLADEADAIREEVVRIETSARVY